MITIGNVEYYSKDEIVEALEYIKEKKMKNSSKGNLVFDKLRYRGQINIILSLFDELPSNYLVGDILKVNWTNDRIHYRDALDNSISSGDLIVYSSFGWVKYKPEKSLYKPKEGL